MNRLEKLGPIALVLTLASSALAGGTLVVCAGAQEPATLDPQREFTEKNHTIVQQIYDGLVRFGPEGTIEPALAVAWQRVEPLRMRFQLREGVRFHNGEPFNAEAVKFTIERYLDPETGFPALSFLDSIDRVEIIDFKTDQRRNAEAEYEKQLSVYYHVLSSVYPDREVTVSLYYSADGDLVTVDPLSEATLADLVRAHR
jgi:peptide/nickel transport system substrate-binding protein